MNIWPKASMKVKKTRPSYKNKWPRPYALRRRSSGAKKDWTFEMTKKDTR